MGHAARIRYIDALRALAIWMVVYAHIVTYGIVQPARAEGLVWHNSVCYMVIGHVFMPLFFFLSGLVGYKAVQNWSRRTARAAVLKRAWQLVPPTVIFFLLYNWYAGYNPLALFRYSGFGKYWFTWDLFLYFIVYYAVLSTVKARRGRDRHAIAVMLAISLALALAGCAGWTVPGWETLGGRKFVQMMLFFALGLSMRYYPAQWKRALGNRWAVTALILLVVPSYVASWHVDPGKLFLEELNIRIVLPLLLVLVSYLAFRYWAPHFDREGPVQRAISLTGRRTLDIYMLQYFLLPCVPELAPLFTGSANIVLEIVVVGTMAAGIIALCLGLSYVIRLSPQLARLLFS